MSKILIIEDESAIRRVLKKIISEENDSYIVEEAEDGLEGVEMVIKNDFDLILCDIKMPKMDGVEVLEKIKKVKPEIPVVMISGHGNPSPDLKRRSTQKGCGVPQVLGNASPGRKNAPNHKGKCHHGMCNGGKKHGRPQVERWLVQGDNKTKAEGNGGRRQRQHKHRIQYQSPFFFGTHQKCS